MINFNTLKNKNNRTVEDPPFARFLFSDTRMSAVWTVIRVLIGLSWLQSGLGKLNNPAWIETGAALQGFWTNAIAMPEQGRPPISFDWYRGFIQGLLDSGSYTWFSKLIVFGEILIGIALIVGAFVGIAAFFAALMNWNFIMAGSASTNGLLLLGAILLVMAWKNAGYFGLDYILLPRLGTPWGRKNREASGAIPQTSPAVGD
ncbi:MAG: DoxX family protein [Chloroflexi bacterium]|nr:DoxX family protein [Chloroflexota bacterium]